MRESITDSVVRPAHRPDLTQYDLIAIRLHHVAEYRTAIEHSVRYLGRSQYDMDVTMAIEDSLQKLIAAQRGGQAGKAMAEKIAQREATFAPIGQRLRHFVGGVDARFIKSRITKDRAVVRIGNGKIDVGWDISANSTRHDDQCDTPLLKVSETLNFMSDDITNEVLWFADCDSLIEYLDHEISQRIASYSQNEAAAII